MTSDDESVLTYIGRDGKTPSAVSECYPGFDVMRLVRADLVDVALVEPETVAHADEPTLGELRYVLTARGAAAVGLSEVG
jgi:hypothetical protein